MGKEKTRNEIKIEFAKDFLSKLSTEAEEAATYYNEKNPSANKLAFQVGYLEGGIREVLRALASS
jgi:hypothetical protein